MLSCFYATLWPYHSNVTAEIESRCCFFTVPTSSYVSLCKMHQFPTVSWLQRHMMSSALIQLYTRFDMFDKLLFEWFSSEHPLETVEMDVWENQPWNNQNHLNHLFSPGWLYHVHAPKCTYWSTNGRTGVPNEVAGERIINSNLNNSLN